MSESLKEKLQIGFLLFIVGLLLTLALTIIIVPIVLVCCGRYEEAFFWCMPVVFGLAISGKK